MEEHRHSTRHRTFKGGSISFKQGIVDCIIRNMSGTGALLEVAHAASLPDQFILIIKPETLKRSCTVAWRDDKFIGVRFE